MGRNHRPDLISLAGVQVEATCSYWFCTIHEQNRKTTAFACLICFLQVKYVAYNCRNTVEINKHGVVVEVAFNLAFHETRNCCLRREEWGEGTSVPTQTLINGYADTLSWMMSREGDECTYSNPLPTGMLICWGRRDECICIFKPQTKADDVV